MQLPKFSEIVADFSETADFIVVYIEEAHPVDGWAFKDEFNIKQHCSQEERCDASKLLLPYVPKSVTLMVDTIDNEANTSYGAVPQRLYIVLEGKIVYQGGMGPIYYNLEEIKDWLAKHGENNNSCEDFKDVVVPQEGTEQYCGIGK